MAWTSDLFIINNIKSSDIGIDGCSLVRTDSEINRQFIGNKSIIEEKLPYRDTPFFFRTEKSPIEFNLKFSILENTYTSDVLFEIGKIFAKDQYVSFQSCDYLGVQFFVICTSINLVTFGSFKGWFEVNLRTSAPFGFSIPEISTFDCTDATTLSPIIIELYNKTNVSNPYGNYYYYPEIWIDMKGLVTAITITNLSLSAETFGFTGLSALESLYINGDLKQIQSSTGLYRLSNMINNHNFLKLDYGLNRLSVNSSSILQFKISVPIYI
jgi:phage-related protein